MDFDHESELRSRSFGQREDSWEDITSFSSSNDFNSSNELTSPNEEPTSKMEARSSVDDHPAPEAPSNAPDPREPEVPQHESQLKTCRICLDSTAEAVDPELGRI